MRNNWECRAIYFLLGLFLGIALAVYVLPEVKTIQMPKMEMVK